MLSVVVDCEEGFDWNRPVRGTPYTLESMRRLHRIDELCRRLGAAFTYVVTYPVLDDEEAWGAVAEVAAGGHAVLGAHLHGWVTPPFGEAATLANSFQGNLAPGHERAKIAALAERMRARTGVRPTVFKAGRSGFGPATAANLLAEGFLVDLSYMPHFDYGAQGGPSFVEASPEPFFFPPDASGGRLLEIPDTAGFLGLLRGAGPGVFPRLDTPFLRGLRVPGVLARGGLLNRVPLTPEGVTLEEARRLTSLLHAEGQLVFQLSFHSTSLVPGETPYTRSEGDVGGLLDWVEGFVGFFRGELGGEVGLPLDIGVRAGRPRS